MLGYQTNPILDVLMVGHVYLFSQKERFLHTDTKISNPFDLLAFLSITDNELRNPDAIDPSLYVLDDVVEY